MKWIRYFESIFSRDYTLEDIFGFTKNDEDDDEDEDGFEEPIEEEKKNKNISRKGTYAEVFNLWETVAEEKKKKSLFLYTLIAAPLSLNSKVILPPGNQVHSATGKRAIDKVVKFIGDLFGGDLLLAQKALFQNDEFKKAFLLPAEEAKNVLLQQIKYLSSEVEKNENYFDQIQKVLRSKLEQIYGSSHSSVNDLNDTFKFIRKEITLVTNKEIARKVVPCSSSTLYKNTRESQMLTPVNSKDLAIQIHSKKINPYENPLDPIFLSSKKGKISVTFDPNLNRNCNQKSNKSKKRFASENQKLKKKKRKERAEKKKLQREIHLKEEEGKFSYFVSQMEDINQFVKDHSIQMIEKVKVTKRRVVNEMYKDKKYRLIVVGRKNGILLDQICKDDVVFVDSLTNATHIVVLSDQLPKSSEKKFKNTQIPMRNKLWYTYFCKNKKEPEIDKKYVFRETEEKVKNFKLIYLFLFIFIFIL
jgi:hypothetical protein